MSYGTLEYWQRRTGDLGKENASQRAEIDQLWRDLHAAHALLRNSGVVSDDQKLADHSAEIEALQLATSAENAWLDTVRGSFVSIMFEAEKALETLPPETVLPEVLKSMHRASAWSKRDFIGEARDQVKIKDERSRVSDPALFGGAP